MDSNAKISSALDFASRRSPVYSRNAMVASSQPLASAAGIEILRIGGNAADAAVSVAAALAVAEPFSTGLGGDAFALYYHAKTRIVTALNGSGRAPAALTFERARSTTAEIQLPTQHPYTVTVPGACAAWSDLLAAHGSKSFATILAPAIRLAQEGFPVSPITAWTWNQNASRLDASPGGRELLIQGRAPRAGEIFRNPGMAATLNTLAESGTTSFYHGRIAQKIAKAVQAQSGLLTEDDLAAHVSTWAEPVHSDYRGVRIHECPPNGQGLVTLLALNILSVLEERIEGDEPNSAAAFHAQIEALRLAFADARRWIADPDFSATPVEALLDPQYAAERAATIRMDRAIELASPGSLPAHSDTVYFCVIDSDGNACSMTNSIFQAFGSGIVPENLGFALHNRGRAFTLAEGHANAPAPGKRPYHTIIPALATRPADNALLAAFGVMGAFMQPQGQVQVARALWRHGLDPQSALDLPRFCIENGDPAGVVLMEDGVSKEVVEALQAMGHKTRTVAGHPRAIFGRGQAILRNPADGVLTAGSDPRADGCAMPL